MTRALALLFASCKDRPNHVPSLLHALCVTCSQPRGGRHLGDDAGAALPRLGPPRPRQSDTHQIQYTIHCTDKLIVAPVVCVVALHHVAAALPVPDQLWINRLVSSSYFYQYSTS